MSPNLSGQLERQDSSQSRAGRRRPLRLELAQSSDCLLTSSAECLCHSSRGRRPAGQSDHQASEQEELENEDGEEEEERVRDADHNHLLRHLQGGCNQTELGQQVAAAAAKTTGACKRFSQDWRPQRGLVIASPASIAQLGHRRRTVTVSGQRVDQLGRLARPEVASAGPPAAPATPTTRLDHQLLGQIQVISRTSSALTLAPLPLGASSCLPSSPARRQADAWPSPAKESVQDGDNCPRESRGSVGACTSGVRPQSLALGQTNRRDSVSTQHLELATCGPLAANLVAPKQAASTPSGPLGARLFRAHQPEVGDTSANQQLQAQLRPSRNSLLVHSQSRFSFWDSVLASTTLSTGLNQRTGGGGAQALPSATAKANSKLHYASSACLGSSTPSSLGPSPGQANEFGPRVADETQAPSFLLAVEQPQGHQMSPSKSNHLQQQQCFSRRR